MRTTKVLAISVPPEFEKQITKYAALEHRTISEFIREAIRQYMAARDFGEVQKAVQKKMKKKGLKPTDVSRVIKSLRD